MGHAEGKHGRLGPFETAIENKDYELLVATVRAKSRITGEGPNGDCWMWQGAKNSEGYPYFGRMGTNRVVHRVVPWGAAGFPGKLTDFPPVHHTCGVRICVFPDHLKPVTAFINTLESAVRNACLNRIRILTDALRAIAPDHALLLQRWDMDEEGQIAQPLLSGVAYESERLQIHRREKRTAGVIKQLRREEARFHQVIEVDSLMKHGMSKREARDQVGMSRSAYDDWKPRLKLWVDSQKG